MMLDDKIWMGSKGPCVGNIPRIDRLGFKGLCLHNWPLVIRQATYASVLPAGPSCGAIWNKDLIYQRGLDLEQEFKDKRCQFCSELTAGALGRSPYGGQNWEAFSLDAYLSSIALSLTVVGMQSSGLQRVMSSSPMCGGKGKFLPEPACVKHFIGSEHSQSKPGETIYSASFNIDDCTLHELYLWSFAGAIKGNLPSIMSSLNCVNNTYTCENSKILNRIVKEELPGS
ncbi:uncharacterized protein N7496_010980 [Penicillium cataractarum]|uniref:beta-glucosidase n=1 Tax=Penicillium cataractarum TaxID=2100454 RepID=A0A9W9RE40_9EURO|nr:uncharacterized protein N7496_010980 [Penicillium cataractarum]KAJ5358567.1 hypothetical protein N7496_010980 [Penicillium cataractarum]